MKKAIFFLFLFVVPFITTACYDNEGIEGGAQGGELLPFDISKFENVATVSFDTVDGGEIKEVAAGSLDWVRFASLEPYKVALDENEQHVFTIRFDGKVEILTQRLKGDADAYLELRVYDYGALGSLSGEDTISNYTKYRLDIGLENPVVLERCDVQVVVKRSDE